jgi:ergothioneine biosynthesis protein EgtB
MKADLSVISGAAGLRRGMVFAGSSTPLEEERERVLSAFVRTRAQTDRLTAPLSPEDQQLQSIPDASPVKWHRAHTSWFFETFVLEPEGVPPMHARYAYLYNSYYEEIGPRYARPKRGMLSRPSAAEVADYRKSIDDKIARHLKSASPERLARLLPIIELGIAHEEQHQELILTDVLHAFSQNPLLPAYQPPAPSLADSLAPDPMRFAAFEGGLHEIGAIDSIPFAFDNESPRHKVWVEPFALGDRLVTAAELRSFIEDGGYETPSLWLSEGFDFVRANQLSAPLYTSLEDGVLTAFTLAGALTLRDSDPVAHVSYYEADAIARYLGARLPTEAEWEIAALRARVSGNFVEDGRLRPAPRRRGTDEGPSQLFGDVWEWTSSSYDPYPGYATPAGALGEYNGKFMVSQKVLRGGSCLTPRRHVRPSYRNFWHPATRFQMTGIRLARGA